jgi:undecaprenyl-diphosphatase
MTKFAEIDSVLLLWINQSAGQSVVLDGLVFDIADAYLLKGCVFLAAYWWLWFERNGERRREIAVAMVAAIATVALSRLLQVGLPFHLRPVHSPSIGVHIPLSVDPETLNTFSSFPSDHAMLFFALAVPLWNRSRWLGAAAMIWAALVICLPRVYLGYHYPSDVLAGAVLGVLCMLVLSALVARTSFPERVLQFSNFHPAPFYSLAFVVSFELATHFAGTRHLVRDAMRLGMMLSA